MINDIEKGISGKKKFTDNEIKKKSLAIIVVFDC